MAKTTLYYFDIDGGLGEPIRLAMYVGGMEFEDKRIPSADWQALKSSGKPPCGQMPFLEVDGKQVSQYHACLLYVGKQTGLYPTDIWAAAKVQEVMGVNQDIRSKIALTLWEKDAEKKAAMRQELATTTLPHWFGVLDNLLAANGSTGYSYGNELSIADLDLHALNKWVSDGILDGIPKDISAPYKNIQKVVDTVTANPKVAEWKEAHKKAA